MLYFRPKMNCLDFEGREVNVKVTARSCGKFRTPMCLGRCGFWQPSGSLWAAYRRTRSPLPGRLAWAVGRQPLGAVPYPSYEPNRWTLEVACHNDSTINIIVLIIIIIIIINICPEWHEVFILFIYYFNRTQGTMQSKTQNKTQKEERSNLRSRSRSGSLQGQIFEWVIAVGIGIHIHVLASKCHLVNIGFVFGLV